MSVHRGTVLIMLWGYYFDKKIQDSEEYNVSPHVKLEIGGGGVIVRGAYLLLMRITFSPLTDLHVLAGCWYYMLPYTQKYIIHYRLAYGIKHIVAFNLFSISARTCCFQNPSHFHLMLHL